MGELDIAIKTKLKNSVTFLEMSPTSNIKTFIKKIVIPPRCMIYL